jgi:membrane-associated phospholipid phosphatase
VSVALLFPRVALAALAASISIVLVATPATAQVRALRWDAGLDTALTLASAGAFLASTVLTPELASGSCRWCSASRLDTSTRRALRWNDPHAADLASDATGLLTLAGAVGADAVAASREGAARDIPLDSLLISEATFVAMDVCLLAKFLVARERPNGSDNLSFFSGHATAAFAVASASGTVATLRGYRSAPLTWVIGGTFALATSYLRIGADAHWLTDVAIGALVGAGVGFAIPYAFHREAAEPSRPNSVPAASPMVSIAW